jgi:glycosyltransferase involved in cell wall biosynthesis
MKLLIVAHYFPLQGPIVFKVRDLLQFLPPLGIDISVISRVNMLDIFHVKAGENVGNARIYRSLTLDIRLAEAVIDVFQIISTFLLSVVVIAHEKVDVVLVSIPPGVPGIGGFLAGKILGKKVMVDVRDRWEEYAIYDSQFWLVRLTNRVLKKIFDILLRKADLVDGVTISLVKYLKARGASKVVYLPNGADVTVFHPVKDEQRQRMRSRLGLRNKDLVLVYAGGIGAYYRPDFVIRCLHQMLSEDATLGIKFFIVGGGEQPKVQDLQTLVKELHLEDRVTLMGEQKWTDVARLLPLCDVGVVPYDDNPLWTYPQPTKFFEYCASGLPVIATVTEDSDLAMLIRQYDIGYAVRPLNLSEFISAVRRLYKLDENERKEIGARARNLVEDSFDKTKIAERLAEALKELCND